MTVSVTKYEVRSDKNGRKYELIPPEGGWGFMVTLSIAIFFSVTIVPVGVFGLIFGRFLRDLGDETSGIAITNSVFNTVVSGTGLVSNHLLQNYSCRKVGLIGAAIFFIGALGTVFVKSLLQIIFTYGILQGFGLGLILPSCFTSFNGYFDKRQTVMMSVAQATIGLIAMGWPKLIGSVMDYYGWRGTQLIVAALSLHCVFAMLTLQPVKWHMKKRYVLEEPTIVRTSADMPQNGRAEILHQASSVSEPLLNTATGHELMKGHLLHNLLERQRPSIIGIGNLATSVASSLDHAGADRERLAKRSTWKKIYDGLDLGLFRDPTFINIAFGLSLALTGDIAFLSLLPMILTNANFDQDQKTLILTVFFTSDLVGRILLSVVSAMVPLRNRLLVLAGTFLTAACRIVFVINDTYMWIMVSSSCLGLLRCLIQIPLPLVVSEVYKERFSTAFTLYMVVCAVISAAFGPLIGFVRNVTESDLMVVNLLTFALLLCAIPWTIELIFTSLRKKEDKMAASS